MSDRRTALALFGSTLLLAISFTWLLSEFGKKNEFATMRWHHSIDQQIIYEWPGGKGGMRNIALESDQPFAIEVGYWLVTPVYPEGQFHLYGYMEADAPDDYGMYRVVMRTWMGEGPCTFNFLSDIPANHIDFRDNAVAKQFTPDYIYEPHWYQRYLGAWD